MPCLTVQNSARRLGVAVCGRKALATRCFAERCKPIVDAKSCCRSAVEGSSKSQKLKHTQCYLRIAEGGPGLSRSCQSVITAIFQLGFATLSGRARTVP